nr:transcription elongation factor GreA [Actinomycetales bacterium]
DVYSESSPLGKSILGRKSGESTTYTAPNGKTFEVEILEVTPFDASL